MRRRKSYTRPVVIREQPTLDLPELDDLVQSYQFRDGGVKKYETGGVDTEDVAGADLTTNTLDQQWADFLDKYPDYTFGGGDQFVRSGTGNWMLNPTWLPSVPIVDDPDNFDYEAYYETEKNELSNQLKEINAFDAKWKGQGEWYAANRGHNYTDVNPYAYSRLQGKYGLPSEIQHKMLNQMPSHHPNYDQSYLNYHNTEYSKFMDQRAEWQRISQEGVDKTNAFIGNLLYSPIDAVFNTPARAVTWGLNEAFGDGSKEVDMRPLMFRTDYNDLGYMTDTNPTSAEVIPGHENRSNFANFLINAGTDPLTYVGGAGAYTKAPNIVKNVVRNAPKNLANSTVNMTKNTIKSNWSGLKKGYGQLINKGGKEASYLNPWQSRIAGTGNSLYYSSKLAALPTAMYSTADFAGRGLFSKEGVTWKDAQNTTFDILDARLPFSSTARDVYKGGMKDYQAGEFMSSKGTPYYVSGVTNSKNPYMMLLNSGAKGYRTLSGLWNDYNSGQ